MFHSNFEMWINPALGADLTGRLRSWDQARREKAGGRVFLQKPGAATSHILGIPDRRCHPRRGSPCRNLSLKQAGQGEGRLLGATGLRPRGPSLKVFGNCVTFPCGGTK